MRVGARRRPGASCDRVPEAGHSYVLPEFDIIRLEALWHGRYKHVATVAGTKACTTLYPDGGTRAQIYSQSGARKVANCRYPIVDPIDVHLYYDPPIRRFKLLDVFPASARDRASSVRRSLTLCCLVTRVS